MTHSGHFEPSVISLTQKRQKPYVDKIAADLLALRVDLAHRSKWNIGYFVAGLALWIAILIVNQTVPIETGRIVWIALSFGVLPTAVLISKIVSADPFCNDNSLGRLVGYTHMSVISLSFPILVIAAIYDPHIQLLTMAILYSIDFYVMTWAFGAALFALHAVARTLAVTVIWVAFPMSRLTLIPIVVAGFYFGTVLLLPPLRRRWLSAHA